MKKNKNMDSIAISQLNERFKALEHAIDIDVRSFVLAAFEYSSYIGSSPYLSDIVRRLANDYDIDKVIFFRLFMYSALREGFRNKNLQKVTLGMPLFVDKEIEEKYGLVSRFLPMMESATKQLKESEKQNVSIYDLVIPNQPASVEEQNISNDEELFKFRILHNQILAVAVKSDPEKVSFNSENGILYIGTKPVRFRKFTKQYDSLNAIFLEKGEVGKEWFFSEIGEKIDNEESHSDKKFQNYFFSIKRQVSAKIGIDDLFITSNQSVKINPKYL